MGAGSCFVTHFCCALPDPMILTSPGAHNLKYLRARLQNYRRTCMHYCILLCNHERGADLKRQNSKTYECVLIGQLLDATVSYIQYISYGLVKNQRQD